MMDYLRSRWKGLIVIVVGMAAYLGPNFGSPNFRYAGSDPDVFVWNFGWPLASLIFDARYGVIMSELLALDFILLFIACVFLYVLLCVVSVVWKKLYSLIPHENI